MPSTRKTYWHLEDARRVPSEYEIGTSRLLTYVDRGGFAVNLPASDWYRRYQVASPLVLDRWEDFDDPRATTYATYVRMQRDQEMYVAHLLGAAQTSGTDNAFNPDWIETLERTMSPLRFVFHGLQMLAAYVGQMAPGGRIVVAALFQAADEVRRIHGIAYRMAQLRGQRADFGMGGRDRWQTDPSWQPLRRTIETLLVTYDWGEALVALNVCVKPILDHLFMGQLATLAERQGDYVDAQLLRSFADDCAWQRAWTSRLLQLVTSRDSGSRVAVAAWIARWRPLVELAVVEVAVNLGPNGKACGDQALKSGAAFMDAFVPEGRGAP